VGVIVAVLIIGTFLLSTLGAGLNLSIGSYRGIALGLPTGPLGISAGPLLPAGSTKALVATATGSPTTGAAPLTVAFKGSASGGTSPYTYSWNFGGTTTSSSQNPSHVYDYTGSYHVVLTVKDSKKATTSVSLNVVVVTAVAGVASSLVSGGVVATTPSTFFSLNAVTDTAGGISTDAAIGTYLSSTPFTWIRYGVDTDSCNESADLSYSDSGVASTGCAFDVADLQKWCNAQSPHCEAILTLPGENNNSAEDAAIAKYVVKTLGFQPAYWSIGNEPMEWTHYGIAWTKWKTTDASKPTSVAYAFDVKAAIAAVLGVDSSAKFIGIEAACQCNTAWFQDIGKIDGSKISAVAYHTYPSTGSTTGVTTAELYGLLASSSNLTTSYANVRSDLTGWCTTCATMPIFVNEYNAGPGWAPSNLAGTYANAVFLAASVAQAMRANVTQLSLYDLQTTTTGSYGYSLLDASDAIGPTGVLFEKLIDHLTVGQVLGTVVKTTVSGVWAVETKSGSKESLLVVNTNLVSSVALSLGSAFPTTTSGTIYQWDANLSAPTATTGLPASAYSIPPQGILLLTV
jgi:PKD repeat protein